MRSNPITFFDSHKLKARQQQAYILKQVYEGWDKYKYFFLSAPTGVGKTFIACAIADNTENAYLLTSTLQLQQQYEESWKELVNLKGRGNYTCALNREFTVDAAPCSASKDLLASCMVDKVCDYYNQKHKALAAQSMITNPMYFLYSTHCGFGADEDSPWVKREVLIVDEAHNLEKHLCSFAESKIEPDKLFTEHGVKTDDIKFKGNLGEDYAMLQVLQERLNDKAEELAEEIEREFGSNAGNKAWAKRLTKVLADRIKTLNKRAYGLDKAIQPLNIFFNTHNNLEELEERWLITADAVENTIQLSPMRGGFLFNEYMGKMASKFVLLSATLGDKQQLCKELDVDESEVLFIETGTPFTPGKSPIIVMPELNMGYANIQNTLPKMAKLVEDIVAGHEGERGIIHSATYKLQEELFRRASPKLRSRYICRDMDLLSSVKFARKIPNATLLERHSARTDSILLSPSMMEGVDLYDDLSKFQVILKMPWASLGDPKVKAKSEIEPGWYANQVWVHLMQASGRSTRNEEDESVTYILDASYPYFYDQWVDRLPAWFTERHAFIDDIVVVK